MVKIFKYTIDSNRMFQILEQPKTFKVKTCIIDSFQIGSVTRPEITQQWSGRINIWLRGNGTEYDSDKVHIPDCVDIDAMEDALEKYCKANGWQCVNSRTKRVQI